MADQGKWFKLWCSTLNDPDLNNLELEDYARWAKLGAYIKEQGKDGKIRFSPPYRGLLELFRLPDLEATLVVLKRFPNCTLGERSFTVSPETNPTVSLEIEYTNWFKYQGDFSSDRVRKFRDKKRHRETVQEERRQEETRREKFIPPTPLEIEAYAKEKNLPLNVQKFFDHYASKAWFVGKRRMADWRAAARLAAADWAKKAEQEAKDKAVPTWM